MGLLEFVVRCGRRFGFSSLLVVAIFTLGTALGLSSSPDSEKIQATYAKDGNLIGVTLVIYGFTTPSELQLLSQAFQEGQDRGLATALSKTKALGNCSIGGDVSFDPAFIQTLGTPTGRLITFITNRPLQSDEVNTDAETESFDLMVGQLDMNDSDNTKSTGFLYPASKLVIDAQGKFHYDLSGSPQSLVDVLDSKWAPMFAEHRTPDAMSPPSQ
jgi:hypothetical protein